MTERAEILGKGIFEVFPDNPADPKASGVRNLRASLERVVQFRKPDTMPLQKYDIRRPNGEFEERYWSPFNSPVFDQNGTLLYIIHSVEDVTEVRESRLELQAYIDNMSTLNAKIDLDGNFLILNRTAQQASGMSRHEVMKTNFLHGPWWTFDPEVHGRVQAAFKRAVSGETVVYDERLRIVNDQIIHINFSLIPVFDANENVVHIIAEGRDVSKLKQAEEELRKSEERFRLLVEGVKDYAIFMIDENGYVASWNEGARAIKGYEAHEIIGKHYSCFFTKEDLAKARPQTELEIAAKNGQFQDECWRLRKDGSTFWASVLVTAIKDETGKIRAYGKLTHDLSARKKAEEELKSLNASLESRIEQRTKELKKSNAELEQFAYVASHDLQEPLRTVSNWAQLLKVDFGEKLNEEASEYLDFIIDAANRMSHMVKDLLEFSRVTHNPKSFSQCDFQDIVEAAINNLQKRISETQTEVKIIGPLPSLAVDRSQFVQVFQNLIGNAIKFRKSLPAKIEISAFAHQATWTFCVKDNGIGIESKYVDRIFDIFKRLHTRDEYPGSGIGLSITKRIVERHHGKIWVESEPGRGSKFFISLPNSSIMKLSSQL